MTEAPRDTGVGPRALLDAARNVNSQLGEDGIIEAILSHLPSRNKWCVEFGAWDGKHLSNTRRLIDDEGYSAVLIEANARTFAALKDTFKSQSGIHCINAFVGFSEADGLDTILARTPCPRDFDVLSIDIDGNDIHVWRAVATYRPKVVCIEFNPTMPSTVAFEQPADPAIKWGASLRSMFELGASKGYRLACANLFNAFFVAEEHWPHEHARSAEEIPRFHRGAMEPVYVSSGFDGTVLLSREPELLCHRVTLRARDVQPLPRFLRYYSGDYNWAQALCYRLLRRLRR